MNDLLILIHADPSVRPMFAREGLDVVAFVGPGVPGRPGGGLSSRYDALAASCNKPGGTVRELAKRYPPPKPLDSYDRVFLATWSAGYAFLRHLTDEDKALVDGLVLLDSGHTGLDADKTASDEGVQWCVWWAKQAREGTKTLWIGHSDVDPVSYASTTKFADEVTKFAGTPRELYLTRAYNVEANPKAEHVAALRKWGPGFVHDALDASAVATPLPAVLALASGFAAGVKAVLAKVPGWFTENESPPMTIGEAIVIRAERDVGHVREVTTNMSPEIDAYLRRVGAQGPANWCAASASCWYLDACAKVGQKPLVKGSAGAKALMGQFQAAKRFVSAAEARKDPSLVHRGDLVFWHRGAPGAWTGHVGVVTRAGRLLSTVEANSGPNANETSDMMVRPLADPLLLGFGRP